MQCPACKEPMAILEYNEVEVDFCAECKGFWLDEGEIDLLFGDEKDCAEFLSIGSPCDSRNEEKRLCPACDTVMTKEATESDPPIVFDACPEKHGLWFDAGELQQILRHGATLDSTGKVKDFLQGLFGESIDQKETRREC
jgi:uncharacterized protein